jgi:hypothetical protein
MQRNDAETLALKGLAWLAGDPDLLARLLAATGLEPDDLRERAGDPELLAAVMDFLLSEDALLGQFCAAEDVKPLTMHRARRLLPGGEI